MREEERDIKWGDGGRNVPTYVWCITQPSVFGLSLAAKRTSWHCGNIFVCV